MRTGRPPKPDKLNDLHGNPGRRKRKKRQDFSASDIKFGIPKGLPQNVRTKARIAAKHLSENKISKDCDRAAFERYCQHLYLADSAYRALKGDGVTETDNRDVVRKHPAAQIHKDNSMAALKFEEHFGLTPLGRGKVKGEPEEKESELEKFQKKGKKLEAVK